MNEHTELLTAMLAEMKSQTEVIKHLAMTNLQLVEAIADAEGEDPAPTHYLDGTPLEG